MPPPHRPASLRGRVFLARRALDEGLLTPDQRRSSAWRRIYRGVYADARVRDDHTLRIAGARLLVPEFAVFSGRSAAHLLGAAELSPPEGPVEISIPAHMRFGPIAGLRVRRVLPIPPEHVRFVGTSRSTAGLRTALDLARCEPLPESVVALDVLLARRITDGHELSRAAGDPSGRGARMAQRAVGLADGQAESQPESRLRVGLVLAGLRPVPQHVVHDRAGRFIARVDLAFPERKVAVECDGAWHGTDGRPRKDRRRLDELVRAGWVVLHVTAADMYDLPRASCDPSGICLLRPAAGSRRPQGRSDPGLPAVG